MTGQDFFAKVSRISHPFGKEKLVAHEPRAFPQRYFKPSVHLADEVPEPSYTEDLQKFHSDLDALRLRYRRFMANRIPPLEIERTTLELKEFDFRYETEADRDFGRVLAGKGDWEQVKIPDYRGPVGKWTAFYRCTFPYSRPQNPDQKIYLRFLGVDYIARVYLNNRFIGSHEGFFAPFEFDVTSFLHWEAENILLIEVQNDVPTIGAEDWGILVDGDKIYAATGPGWDDPVVGWHHCPPGAGIYNRVLLEERSTLFIQSLFTRPNIDNRTVEAWVEVWNAENTNREFQLELSIYPRNFDAAAITGIPCQANPAGPGANSYRFILPMPDFRLWSPEEPWLYELRASIAYDGQTRDQKDCSFGMRKFHMDEQQEPKGTLYLNNQPILLRGANEMGHLQQCVMQGNFDQLVDDILIARLANMNYFRITQRPVQEEIYTAFDQLGMLHQCDLPLFGYLRRNQFYEAVRQCGEMERLIRNHPSSIMVSFINEPFPIGRREEEAAFVSYADKGFRHLYRDEMEAFFRAAREAIAIENPDRVVKNVEGDYDPPTANGLSDFHCYPLWYTNHAIPVGKLYKGYLPALKVGWKTGCGEYGTEGLDNYSLMRKHYPQDWLPESDESLWNPDKIIRSQTFTMQGDWFEEQNRIHDWIRESQRHQTFATRMLTDALRRRSDLVISTAIHLLIDAWPAGWMKTLVGVDRIPKPAYFAFQKNLVPVRVNLRCDRWKAYCGETLGVEAWVLNDTPVDILGMKIVSTVRIENQNVASFELDIDSPAVQATQAGIIPVRVPEVHDREIFYVDAMLLDGRGRVINRERFELEAFEKDDASLPVIETSGNGLSVIGGKNGRPERIICSLDRFCQNQAAFLEHARSGARVIVLIDKGEKIELPDLTIPIQKMNGLFFLARNAQVGITKDFNPGDFSFWYNREKEYIDFLATSYLDCDRLTPLLFTYQKPGFAEFALGAKRKLAVVGALTVGKGEMIFSTLAIRGMAGSNPVLDRFLGELIA